MEFATVISIGVTGLFVGFLIGSVGIGGVLLLPILTYLFGIDIHAAIAVAMFGYIFSGLVGSIIYNQHGSIKWSMAGWLIAGAMPGGLIGAIVASESPGLVLEALIGIFILFAGARAIFVKSDPARSIEFLTGPKLIFIGFVTGVFSSLTGTGGPLVLVPLMVFLKVATHVAVGLSQVIQFPIAILATTGNYFFGLIDVTIAGIIAGGLTIGCTIGAKVAHKLSAAKMSKLVAWVLLCTGMMMICKIFIMFLL